MGIKLLFCLMLTFALCLARNPFPDRTDRTFLKQCLSATNQFRARHHSPAIRMDRKMVSYARRRCGRVSRYEGLSNGHAGLRNGYGENLYWAGSSDRSLQPCFNAIKAWYDEVKHYNFGNPGFSSATGHFTQLVWKSSVRMGCARCNGKGGQWWETYVVCNYNPPGNFAGRYRENVLRS